MQGKSQCSVGIRCYCCCCYVALFLWLRVGTGTRSWLSGQSKPAGPEREAASHTEAVPICVFCPYAHGRPHTTQLYQHVPETRWPIVYSPRYNITFMGLEKLHPFDAGKWGKVISFLKGMEGPTWTLHLLPPPTPTAFL